jgi:A/G-specific adenine glycosylase
MTVSDEEFKAIVWKYFSEHARDMPWRILSDDVHERLYQVLVSECMLQQTQVSRVIDKYQEWMEAFPTMQDAASASTEQILGVWVGLGYNRRAKWLADACRALSSDVQPDLQRLCSLKGIGKNTAGAIITYTYNRPTAFIETNIRTVYLHHFFPKSTRVGDAEILECVERTLDEKNPRNWMYALMDYGSHLKSRGHSNKQSSAYKKQTRFAGSTRQLRAKILRYVLEHGSVRADTLCAELDDERAVEVAGSLVAETMLTLKGNIFKISQ